jgi:hypothetical protein
MLADIDTTLTLHPVYLRKSNFQYANVVLMLGVGGSVRLATWNIAGSVLAFLCLLLQFLGVGYSVLAISV